MLVGRIESGGSVSAALSSEGDGAGSGITVAVGRVKSDGALEVLASAAAAADGSYRSERVPAGIDRLVIVATSGETEIGRAIVHEDQPHPLRAPVRSATLHT